MANNGSNDFSDEEEVEFKYQYTYTRVSENQQPDDDDDDEEEIGYAYYAKAGKLDSSDSETEPHNKFQTIASDDETDQTQSNENNNNANIAHVSNGTSHVVPEEITVEHAETIHTLSTPPVQYIHLPNQREPVSEEQLRREAMQNFDQNYENEVGSVQSKPQKVEFSKEHVQDIKEVMKGITINFEPSWAAKFNSKNWSDTVDKIKKDNSDQNQ